MNDPLETAKEIFAWAEPTCPADCELEVYLSRGRGRSVVWGERKCEDLNQAEGSGAGIRVVLGAGSSQGGRQGFAFTTALTRDHIEKTAQRALDAAARLPSDPFRRLPKSEGLPAKTGGLSDPSAFSEDLQSVMDRLREGEDRLLREHPLLKSVLRAGFSEGASETAIVNSHGVEGAFSGTHIGLGVSCLAEKDGERQEGGFGQTKRFKKDLDWEETFKTAADRTLALLGGRTIPSGHTPVVFDPTVACEFLSLISEAVCAESVQKGKSPLAGKIGETVASGLVTIVDDGALPGGLATAPVDDEGVPTQRTPVISAGKLEHYLYDTYTALKDKTKSTGNAGRSGFKSSPSSGPSNFFLQAGPASRAKLLQETRGLYLYDVMGLHMADPISGDFSVAVMGAWLDKGEFKYGVRGVTLAGNLIELLKRVDAVCDDLSFFGSVGSPTFRVGELMVSGS